MNIFYLLNQVLEVNLVIFSLIIRFGMLHNFSCFKARLRPKIYFTIDSLILSRLLAPHVIRFCLFYRALMRLFCVIFLFCFMYYVCHSISHLSILSFDPLLFTINYVEHITKLNTAIIIL